MLKQNKTLLVTGGAGFIGSEFVRQAVNNGLNIVVLDKISYSGDLERLSSVKHKIQFYKTDIAQKTALENVFKKVKPTAIVHFAAETHVDRSIHHSIDPFIQANVIGTQNLIELSRKYQIKRFIHISTDEVYGQSRSGKFKENSPISPNNPYSATKASAEMLVKAAIHTFEFPAIIIRPANNYGPWQYPEKFIPVIITKALKGANIPVYGKGLQIREWLHVTDCASAIHFILKKGTIGEAYNIGSYFEKPNIETAKTVLKLLGKNKDQIEFVKDRPGHDFRYSVDCEKLHKLGWKPKVTFKEGISQTVDWYMSHQDWLKKKIDFLEKYWKTVYR